MKESTNVAEKIGQSVIVTIANTAFSAIGELAKFALVVFLTFAIAHLLLANVSVTIILQTV